MKQQKNEPKKDEIEEVEEEETKKEDKNNSKEIESKIKGINMPKHRVVYSSPVDLGELIDNRYKNYKRPKEVSIIIQVPLLVIFI